MLYDIQCPVCAVFHTTLESVLAEFSEQIDVRYLSHPLDYHPLARPGTHAAECAYRAGIFPDWISLVFAQQDSLATKGWERFALDVGLSDISSWESCLAEMPAQERIDLALGFGRRIEIHGTPTVIVNGWRYGATPSEDVLRDAIIRLGDRAVSVGDSAHGTSQAWLETNVAYRTDELLLPPKVRFWSATNFAVIDRSGNLFVAQPAVPEIRVFSAQGDSMRVMGRRGEGPGEFGTISSIGLLGDTMVATDAARGRVTYFGTDGTLLGSRRWIASVVPTRVNERWMFAGSTPEAVRSDLRGIVRPALMALGSEPAVGPDRFVLRIPILGVDSSGHVVDTIAWEALEGASMGFRRGGRLHHFQVPFQDSAHVAVLADGSGVVTAHSRLGPARSDEVTLSVTRVDFAGDTVLAFMESRAARPVTEEMIRRLAGRARTSSPGLEGMSDDEAAGLLRDSGLLPAMLPTATGVMAGQDGSIWIRREESLDLVEWTVLRGDGTLRGSVMLPSFQRVIAARGDLAVVADEDELGRVVVIGYRIRNAPTTSASTATAISSGVHAPMGSPTGP